jgi:hypothetical protein
VIELFVFVQLGRNVKEDMIVKLLPPKDETPEQREARLSDTPDLQNQNQTADLVKFDAGKAETFDPNDRQRLLAVIEASFGTFDPFNKIIRATYPTAKLEASADSVISGHSLTLTPTFKNGMDVRITSDDGSAPITYIRSGRPSTVKPTKSTTKYTLTVVSPNGIKVSDSVTIKVETQTPASTANPKKSKRSNSFVSKASSSSMLARCLSFTRRVGKVQPALSEATVADTAATDTKADSKDEGGREHVVTLSP